MDLYLQAARGGSLRERLARSIQTAEKHKRKPTGDGKTVFDQ